MAIVQYTAIVNQIRGKLNGSVFNKSRNAYTLQRKQQPKRAITGLQMRRRSLFASVQRHWKLLSPVDRSNAAVSAQNNPVRDRFGNETVLSGYNHWVKANVVRVTAGFGIVGPLSMTPAPPFNYILESSYIEFSYDTSGRLIIQPGAILQVASANTAYISLMTYISYPMSRGVLSYSGRWFYLSQIGRSAGGFPAGEIDLEYPKSLPQDYPMPEQGQKILLRIDAWAISFGAKVNSQAIEIEF